VSSITVRDGLLFVLLDPFQMKTKAGIMLPTMQNRMGRPCKGRVLAGDFGPYIRANARVCWEMGADRPPEGEPDVVALLEPAATMAAYLEEDEMISEEEISDAVDDGNAHKCKTGAVIAPAPGRILVEFDEYNTTTKGGVVLPDSATQGKRAPNTGLVLAIGEGCPTVYLGKRVGYELGTEFGVQEGKEVFGVIKPQHVLLVYHVDGDEGTPLV